MERFITSTQLKQELRQAKEYAREDLVHVLEHGHAAFVLCSLDVYERHLEEARARAVWRVDVEESMRESEQDVRADRVCTLSELGIHVSPARAVRITESAWRELDARIDSIGRAIVIHMLEEIVERPEMGITVEYGLRKVLVPPYDVLYTYEQDHDEVLVRGVIPSLD